MSCQLPGPIYGYSSIIEQKHKFADNSEIIWKGDKFILLKTIETVSLN